jgi:hypothetical protein
VVPFVEKRVFEKRGARAAREDRTDDGEPGTVRGSSTAVDRETLCR